MSDKSHKANQETLKGDLETPPMGGEQPTDPPLPIIKLVGEGKVGMNRAEYAYKATTLNGVHAIILWKATLTSPAKAKVGIVGFPTAWAKVYDLTAANHPEMAYEALKDGGTMLLEHMEKSPNVATMFVWTHENVDDKGEYGSYAIWKASCKAEKQDEYETFVLNPVLLQAYEAHIVKFQEKSSNVRMFTPMAKELWLTGSSYGAWVAHELLCHSEVIRERCTAVVTQGPWFPNPAADRKKALSRVLNEEATIVYATQYGSKEHELASWIKSLNNSNCPRFITDVRPNKDHSGTWPKGWAPELAAKARKMIQVIRSRELKGLGKDESTMPETQALFIKAPGKGTVDMADSISPQGKERKDSAAPKAAAVAKQAATPKLSAAEAKKKVKELTEENGELTRQLKEATTKAEESKKELDALKVKVGQLETGRDAKQREYNTLQTLRQREKEAHDKAKGEYDWQKLEDEKAKAKLQEEVQALTTQNTNAREEKRRSETAYNELKVRYDQLTADKGELTNTLEQKNSAIRDLEQVKAEKEQLAGAAEGLRRENERLRMSLQELASDNAEVSAQARQDLQQTAADDRIKGLEAQVKELQNNLTLATTDKLRAEESCKEAVTEQRDLQKRLTEAISDHGRAVSRMEELNKKVEDAQGKLGRAFDEKHAAVSAQLNKQAELDKANRRIEELESERASGTAPDIIVEERSLRRRASRSRSRSDESRRSRRTTRSPSREVREEQEMEEPLFDVDVAEQQPIWGDAELSAKIHDEDLSAGIPRKVLQEHGDITGSLSTIAYDKWIRTRGTEEEVETWNKKRHEVGLLTEAERRKWWAKKVSDGRDSDKVSAWKDKTKSEQQELRDATREDAMKHLNESILVMVEHLPRPRKEEKQKVYLTCPGTRAEKDVPTIVCSTEGLREDKVKGLKRGDFAIATLTYADGMPKYVGVLPLNDEHRCLDFAKKLGGVLEPRAVAKYLQEFLDQAPKTYKDAWGGDGVYLAKVKEAAEEGSRYVPDYQLRKGKGKGKGQDGKGKGKKGGKAKGKGKGGANQWSRGSRANWWEDQGSWGSDWNASWWGWDSTSSKAHLEPASDSNRKVRMEEDAGTPIASSRGSGKRSLSKISLDSEEHRGRPARRIVLDPSKSRSPTRHSRNKKRESSRSRSRSKSKRTNARKEGRKSRRRSNSSSSEARERIRDLEEQLRVARSRTKGERKAKKKARSRSDSSDL